MLGIHPDQEQHQALRDQHVFGRSHLILSKNTRSVLVLKERFRKEYGDLTYVVHALSVWPKRALHHLFVAASLNLVRMAAWLQEKPQAQTRLSRFRKLASTQSAQVPA